MSNQARVPRKRVVFALLMWTTSSSTINRKASPASVSNNVCIGLTEPPKLRESRILRFCSPVQQGLKAANVNLVGSSRASESEAERLVGIHAALCRWQPLYRCDHRPAASSGAA